MIVFVVQILAALILFAACVIMLIGISALIIIVSYAVKTLVYKLERHGYDKVE